MKNPKPVKAPKPSKPKRAHVDQAPATSTDLDSVMHPKFLKVIAVDPMQKRKVGSDEARLAWLEK
jgi:hypothetical protein